MELSKDIDLESWKRTSAAACYASASQAPKFCMYSASGETICQRPNAAPFWDGAAAILGPSARPQEAPKPFCGYAVEPFNNSQPTGLERCMDGSQAVHCVQPNNVVKQEAL